MGCQWARYGLSDEEGVYHGEGVRPVDLGGSWCNFLFSELVNGLPELQNATMRKSIKLYDNFASRTSACSSVNPARPTL